MDYKNTIITPKTDFPMRGGLPQREPGMLAEWNKIDIYAELRKKNAGKPRFVLHDGPPFSNGDIHMGHALNKTLKDFIVRSYAMRGYDTPYTPGWDNHGMPIESAIIKKNKLNRKAMSVPDFRSACRDFALEYVDRQRKGFQRLGIVADWEKPYCTMDKEFEAEEVKVFGEMYRKGYIYKGLKPVYWCAKDETALAEAEIEYQDDPCTTVYVKFPMQDDLGKLSHLDHSRLFFVIWTTTIWTLPGNMGISLHPRESYAIVKAPNGEMYVMAEALIGKVMKVAGFDAWEVLETHPGSFFENMLAKHPFLPKTSRLLNAEYVTMDSGTGCVHTAPGFGADDYQTCMRYGMDLVVPVDDQGRHTDYAGKYAGLKTEESNPIILADMKESGMLLASEDVIHSYPHCWRCKSPIIFRATPQWFCSVESFKDEAAAACEDVRWLPAWGKDRLISMIRERNDWCISRQRRWGLPIPVFYCKDCGKPVCTPETIARISELFGEHGSNIWFEKDAMELIPQGFACPNCGGKLFEKETDTLDGWFDSGSTHISFLKRENPENWPADVYLEGADQYRGWFQSSLLISVGAMGQGAPFKACLTHGWTVDGEGRAMHKSLGNLDGFDANDLVKPEDMLELDRWAMTRLNKLIETGFKAYDNYEFHVLTHAVNDFCVVELSQFYLDILKDRLYCEARDGLKRRSAQTALYLILDTMAKLFAPILAFTCDEIWQAMPHREGDDPRNILFNDMNQPFADYALDDETMARWDTLVRVREDVNGVLEKARADKRNILFNEMNQPFTDYALDEETMAKWDTLIRVREDVNGVLEQARADKRIGKALEARVHLLAQDEAAKTALNAIRRMDLKELFIVSGVTGGTDLIPEAKLEGVTAQGTNFPGMLITVSEAQGTKCPRCWMHSIDANAEGLCPRCAAVMAKLETEI